MKTPKTLVNVAAMVVLSGTAYAGPEFQGRLADGTASATCTVSGPDKCTMFYNATLDITILNDWSIGAGFWSATAAAGSAQSVAESAGFAASGLSGWVLPTGDGNAPAGPQNQYLSIFNDAGFRVSDQFDGVQRTFAYYWSGTEYASYPVDAWLFVSGNQSTLPKNYELWAVAVRPGDVAAVPEPEVYALLLAGLGLLNVVAKRRLQSFGAS